MLSVSTRMLDRVRARAAAGSTAGRSDGQRLGGVGGV
jgi:hypothetical protein